MSEPARDPAPCGRELLAQDDMRDAQRQRAFHSRPAGNPLIGVGAGLRHTRFDLHEFCAAAGTALAHLAVTDRLRDGRVPGSEKIGAEGNHIIRAGKIERGQRGVAEAEQICLAQHGFIEGLVPDRRRRAVGFQEPLDQFVALSAQGPRQKGKSIRGLRCLQRGQVRGQFLQRIVPGYLLELAGAARAGALDRVSDAIRMVEHLQACLTAGAQLALIDGMLRIAFEFFRQAHLDQPVADHDARLLPRLASPAPAGRTLRSKECIRWASRWQCRGSALPRERNG